MNGTGVNRLDNRSEQLSNNSCGTAIIHQRVYNVPDWVKSSHETVYKGSNNYRVGDIPIGYQTGSKYSETIWNPYLRHRRCRDSQRAKGLGQH